MSGAGWASAPAKWPARSSPEPAATCSRRALPPGRATPRTHRGHRPPQPAPLRRFARPGGLPPDGRPTIRHHRPRQGTGRVPGRNRRRHPRHALLRTRHMECAGNLAPRTRRASGGAGRGLRFQTRLPAVRPSHPDSRSVEIAPYRPRILHRNAARRLRRRIGHRALRRNRPMAFAPRHGDPRRKAVAGVRRSRRAAGRRPFPALCRQVRRRKAPAADGAAPAALRRIPQRSRGRSGGEALHRRGHPCLLSGRRVLRIHPPGGDHLGNRRLGLLALRRRREAVGLPSGLRRHPRPLPLQPAATAGRGRRSVRRGERASPPGSRASPKNSWW